MDLLLFGEVGSLTFDDPCSRDGVTSSVVRDDKREDNKTAEGLAMVPSFFLSG